MRSLELDPRSLQPNPWNSNKVSPENMEKLKRSISDLGFSTAVVVREVAEGYQILGGAHRTKAAIELGLETIPVVNMGEISDVQARKIGLTDNHRYGTDDAIQLAKIFEEIGADSAEIEKLIPVSQADIDAVLNIVEMDLDDFDVELPEDEDDEDGDEPPTRERPERTHDILKFRVTLKDAELIRQVVEKTIKRESLGDQDEMSAAGAALAYLLLS